MPAFQYRIRLRCKATADKLRGSNDPQPWSHAGALPGLSRALLAWSRSFTNFAEVARDQQFYGWSEASADQPCSWTGIGCEDGLVSIELRDVGLQGEAAAGRTSQGKIKRGSTDVQMPPVS